MKPAVGTVVKIIDPNHGATGHTARVVEPGKHEFADEVTVRITDREYPDDQREWYARPSQLEVVPSEPAGTCTGPGGCASCPEPWACHLSRVQCGLEKSPVDQHRYTEIQRNPFVFTTAKDAAVLPADSESRKGIPLVTGLLDYFPAALREVAKVSKAGNDKHNPGEPLHWARGKSMDQADAVARHLMERGGFDPDTGLRQTAHLAWRALALLQIELEEAGEAPLARGASA